MPASSAFRPVELKDRSGWYVLYSPAGFAPSEQINGFSTEKKAKDWIARESKAWLSKRKV